MICNVATRLSAVQFRKISRGSVLLCAVILLILPAVVSRIADHWQDARGYEYEWIAKSLASGTGYSLAPNEWLGPYRVDHSPTAWEEPLHTFIMASSFRLLGERGRLALVLLNVLWIGLAAVLVWRFVGLRSVAGSIAASAYLLYQYYAADPWLYIGNTAVATFLFALVATLLSKSLQQPSARSTAALAVVIGIAHLTHAGSLLFGVVAGALMYLRYRRFGRAAWGHALLVAFLPLMIVSPWTLRNYSVFETLVPVRTGLGWQLFIGNPAVAMTLGSSAEPTDADLPWRASGALDAVVQIRDLLKESALRDYSYARAVADLPQYGTLNEAQRDAYFTKLAVLWMVNHPLTTSRLIAARTYVFLFGWSRMVTLVTLLAGLAVVVHRRDIRVVALALLCVVYSAPYALSIIFYYRYRAPVEPFLFMLIGVLIAGVWDQRGRTQRLAAEIASRLMRIIVAAIGPFLMVHAK